MKKKTAALCMAALMAVTLTACGGQAGQAEPTPEVQPQETQEEVQQESEDTEPTEPASEETGLEACTRIFRLSFNMLLR